MFRDKNYQPPAFAEVKNVSAPITWEQLGTWQKYLFSCSSLPKLYTKKEPLSIPTLKAIHEEVHTGIRKEVSTRYTERGIDKEETAIRVLSAKRKKKYYKNFIKRGNKHVAGTPDIVDEALRTIIDVKIVEQHIFDDLTRDKALARYFWQLVGYCWLWGYNKAELAFLNPELKQIKIVAFEVTQEHIDDLTTRCELWTEWLKWYDTQVVYDKPPTCTSEEGFAQFMQGVAEDAQELRGKQEINIDEIPF